MAESMTCYACDRDPVQQCPRCGRPFCEDHGDDVCAVCLHPSSGVPSFNLYRGSLLALLVGAALAVWLIIQPTGDEGETALGPTIQTATPTSVVPISPTAPVELTPGAGTPPASPTTGAPAPTETPSAGGGGEYTVQAGDTLSSICAAQAPGVADCVEQLRSLNGIVGDTINIGQVLQLPQ
jgi:LysM repeat protein